MPVQNYKREKRQKDIEKKKKRDAKIMRKQSKKNASPVAGSAPTPEIRQLLEQTHHEIEQTQDLDEKGQELLRGNKADIAALLEQAENNTLVPHPSMIQRLEESIKHLEATHPVLTETLTNLLNILNNAGF